MKKLQKFLVSFIKYNVIQHSRRFWRKMVVQHDQKLENMIIYRELSDWCICKLIQNQTFSLTKMLERYVHAGETLSHTSPQCYWYQIKLMKYIAKRAQSRNSCISRGRYLYENSWKNRGLEIRNSQSRYNYCNSVLQNHVSKIDDSHRQSWRLKLLSDNFGIII